MMSISKPMDCDDYLALYGIKKKSFAKNKFFFIFAMFIKILLNEKPTE
jgi:hypothetical protein